MDINTTFAGEVISISFFINFIVMMYLTLRFAKGNTNNFPLVGLYTFLLSFLFPPGSWFYCWYWSKKYKTVAN
jgi:hypothetical protein